MIPVPRNILVSYHYYRKYDLDKLDGLTIIGDSGAYSARTTGVEITNEELIAWISRWRHRLCWAACMDVSGNPELTRRNWNTLVDAGIPAVSTIHMGTHPSEMDYYAERGVDFLGLGGMAGGVTPFPGRMRWLISVFRYAQQNHPQMRFHGWGVSSDVAMQLPFYSIDSSGWASAYLYARLALRDPRSGKDYNVALDGKGVYEPEVAMLLRDQYGVNPSDVARSKSGNRRLIVRLAALSASVQEQRLRKLHRGSNITRPMWGRLADAEPVGPNQHLVFVHGDLDVLRDMMGPNSHLVDGSPQHLELIADLARHEEARSAQ